MKRTPFLKMPGIFRLNPTSSAALLATAFTCLGMQAQAASGTWISTVTGTWSGTQNWAGNVGG